MQVLLFCPRGFETMEWSVFVDVMGWARTECDAPVTVVTGGFSKRVVSTFGAAVVMDKTWEEIDPAAYDALALPGGFEAFGFYEEAFDPRLLELIRTFDGAGKPIAAVCVAALALGKSGVLRGRRGTTYHLKGGARQAQLAAFGVEVLNRRVVVDGNIVTSHCPETAPDVAFALLGMLCGEHVVKTVRGAMGFEG